MNENSFTNEYGKFIGKFIYSYFIASYWLGGSPSQ